MIHCACTVPSFAPAGILEINATWFPERVLTGVRKPDVGSGLREWEDRLKEYRTIPAAERMASRIFAWVAGKDIEKVEYPELPPATAPTLLILNDETPLFPRIDWPDFAIDLARDQRAFIIANAKQAFPGSKIITTAWVNERFHEVARYYGAADAVGVMEFIRDGEPIDGKLDESRYFRRAREAISRAQNCHETAVLVVGYTTGQGGGYVGRRLITSKELRHAIEVAESLGVDLLLAVTIDKARVDDVAYQEQIKMWWTEQVAKAVKVEAGGVE